MTKPTAGKNLYIKELSLLLSVVFYCNSMVMICELFLSRVWTLLVTAESLTFLFLATRDCLKMDRSYESLYWNFFFLENVCLVSTGDRSNWDFSRGCLLLSAGFIGLFLYTLYMRKGSSQEEKVEQRPDEESKVPKLVEGAFVLMGSGTATMGRSLVPEDNVVWIFAVGAVMFLESALFFCYYYENSKAESDCNDHHHQE